MPGGPWPQAPRFLQPKRGPASNKKIERRLSNKGPADDLAPGPAIPKTANKDRASPFNDLNLRTVLAFRELEITVRLCVTFAHHEHGKTNDSKQI